MKEITREEFVLMLYNFAQMRGYDVAARSDLSQFTDGHEISSYAHEAMSWAVRVGIIEGNGTGYNAQGEATRVETAAILQRYINLK